MRLVRVVNSRSQRELGSRIGLADGWLARLRGMLGRPEPIPGEGLLLTPCRSIHMYGMSYSLDVAFLDVKGAIIAMYPSLFPGSRTRWHRKAVHALELPVGALADSGAAVGDVLLWSPVSASPVIPAQQTMEALS